MPRPKRNRIINTPPKMEGFKPFGIPMSQLEPVILLYEEFESLRLCDYDGLTQEEAAECMGVSRPTFTRIYNKTRQKLAQAFVEAKAIIIEGGNFQTEDFWYKCNSCQQLNIVEQSLKRCNYCNSQQLRLLNCNNE